MDREELIRHLCSFNIRADINIEELADSICGTTPEVKAYIKELEDKVRYLESLEKSNIYCRRNYRKLWGVWQGMRNRCENPNADGWERYGGRGIKVCDEWQDSSAAFIEWAVKNGYKEGLQLDRIDNGGNYNPENCQWITPKENSRKRRNTVNLTIDGETRSVAEWCENMELTEVERCTGGLRLTKSTQRKGLKK